MCIRDRCVCVCVFDRGRERQRQVQTNKAREKGCEEERVWEGGSLELTLL